MNKQELIETVIELPVDCSGSRPKIDKLTTLELIKLLDEPEKVKVPQFVADWYEENKTNLEYNIWEYIYNWDKQNVSQIKTWFDYSSNKPLQTLINMKQFGYEVEEEKRYRVKLKGTSQCLRKDGSETRFSSLFISDFTINDIEDLGFGWVFDCEGVEVEEVQYDTKI
jgi:hypothetical protein